MAYYAETFARPNARGGTHVELVLRETALLVLLSAVALPETDRKLLASRGTLDAVAELSVSFFNTLYQKRPEVDQVFGNLRSRLPLILKGERGSGKSTIMRLIDQVQSSPTLGVVREPILDVSVATKSVHYMDFLERKPELSSQDTPVEVCDLVYRELLKLGASDESFRTAWNSYRSLRSSIFDDVRESLAEQGMTLESGDDPLAAVKTADILADWRAARRAFDATKADHKLKLLLEFLGSECSHTPLLLLDNLDHLPEREQFLLWERLEEMCTWNLSFHMVAAALRTRNYEHHLRTAVAGQSFLVQGISADFIESAGEDAIDLQGEARFVTKVFARRLDAILELAQIRLEAADPEVLERALSLGGWEDLNALLGEYRSGLRSLVKHKTNATLARNLVRWHNGAIQGACGSAFNLVHQMTLGHSDFYRLDGFIPSRPRNRDADPIITDHDHLPRRARTSMWRYLTFMGRVPPEDPHTTLLLANAQPHGDRPSYFLQLKILEILRVAPDGHLSYERLLRQLRILEVVETPDICEALVALVSRRGSEVSGLIRADCSKTTIQERRVRPETRVEIAQAGLLMVNELAPSCEYMFWNALYDEDFRELELTEIDTALGVLNATASFDEGLVARTVCLYLSHVIEAKYQRELQELSGNGDAASRLRSRYRETLGYRVQQSSWAPGAEPFPVRCAKSLTDFVDDKYSEVDQPTKQSITTQMRQMIARFDP